MSNWRAFEDEVARSRDAGRAAELWWRDDDAADAGPALDRLLSVQHETQVPLALAVVPATATQALAARLVDESGVDVLQHGYAHTNHAPAGEKKMELGAHRPAMLVLGDLGTGWMALERLFGARALPVLVHRGTESRPCSFQPCRRLAFAASRRLGRGRGSSR